MNEIDKRLNEPKNDRIRPHSQKLLQLCEMKGGIRASEVNAAYEKDAPAIFEFAKGELNMERQELLSDIQATSKMVGDALNSFKELASEAIVDIRNFRMTVAREMAGSLTALQDIRKFFLSPEHRQEVAALAEFVLLCEKLEALKRSGFLDAVSETILNLELKKTV